MKNKLSNIRIVEKKGSRTGKTIVIMAGVHGNESCGVEAFNNLIPKLKIIKGKVIFIYANLEAIKQEKRFIECDLNRCFLNKQSKEISNTLEGKTARAIMPFLDGADMLLDIHASNSKNTLPFVISENRSFGIAKAMPVKVISCNWDKFHKGSSDSYMNEKRKKAICIECGYLKKQKSAKVAEIAIEQFLIKLGASRGKLRENSRQTYCRIINSYKNKSNSFRKAREFADYEFLKKRTLIGYDGNKKVYGEMGWILFFVRDREGIGSECFLIAEFN